jgi:osmotically-inducible protein OsmY
MRTLIVFILGVVVGVAGYWFVDERDADFKVKAQGGDTGTVITVSGEGAKEKAREIGDKLKEAGAAAVDVTSDAAITAAVKVKLAADAEISALKIDVDTKDGVVTLSGSVTSAALTEKASTIAKSVAGVKEVKTNLRVEGQP